MLINRPEKIYLSSSIAQWTREPFLFGAMLSTVPGAGIGYQWLALMEGIIFMVDNGAFTGKYQFRHWVRGLKKLRLYKPQCLGVIIPDKPFDWTTTLAMFKELSPYARSLGFPVALAIQNGVRLEDVKNLDFDTVFVGGDKDFKRRECWPVIDYAHEFGKWIHVGRVNGETNLVKHYGYADSWDGTTFSRHPTQQFEPIRRGVISARHGFNTTIFSEMALSHLGETNL